jgi:hypothetical protein
LAEEKAKAPQRDESFLSALSDEDRNSGRLNAPSVRAVSSSPVFGAVTHPNPDSGAEDEAFICHRRLALSSLPEGRL